MSSSRGTARGDLWRGGRLCTPTPTPPFFGVPYHWFFLPVVWGSRCSPSTLCINHQTRPSSRFALLRASASGLVALCSVSLADIPSTYCHHRWCFSSRFGGRQWWARRIWCFVPGSIADLQTPSHSFRQYCVASLKLGSFPWRLLCCVCCGGQYIPAWTRLFTLRVHRDIVSVWHACVRCWRQARGEQNTWVM